MMKPLTTEQILDLYKSKVRRLFPRDEQPEFNLGDLVRVKMDADDIYGEFLGGMHEDRWKRGLISGFDKNRQKRRGEIGYVEGISRVALKVRGMKHTNYQFQIRYEDSASLSMDGDWLEPAIPLDIEGIQGKRTPVYVEMEMKQ